MPTPYIIRNATEADAPMVGVMIYGLHVETQAYGTVIAPGHKTATWVRECVMKAIDGQGLCLIARSDEEAVGCLLAVDVEWPYDSRLGRGVMGLGTYVVPGWRRTGVAHALYQEAKKALLEKGYDSYVGAYLVRNDKVKGTLKRTGFKDVETSVVMDLRGE